MISVTCTEKIRDKNNRIIGYELQDCNGNKMQFTSEQVKQAIFLQQITVKNLKLTSDGRLIDNTSEDTQQFKDDQLALVNTIKTMKCHEIMRLDFDNIRYIIEKLSSIKLEEIRFPKYPEYIGYEYKLYSFRCMPFLIGRSNTNTRHCEKCKEPQYCVLSISFPTVEKDSEYSRYKVNKQDGAEFIIGADDPNGLIQVASIWRNIPNTCISYKNIASALYELITKYTTVNNKLVNNRLKFSWDAYSGNDNGLSLDIHDYVGETNNTPVSFISDINATTLVFRVGYEAKREDLAKYTKTVTDNKIRAEIMTVILYVTQDGYVIRIIGYEHEIREDAYYYNRYAISNKPKRVEATIGFNDNLKDSMTKVKLLIDDEFKSSLREAERLVSKAINKEKQ